MNNPSLKPVRKSHIEQGEIYFWTATINKWQRLLENDEYKNVIVESLEYLSSMGKIDVFAFVIMPNHLHGLLVLHNSPSVGTGLALSAETTYPRVVAGVELGLELLEVRRGHAEVADHHPAPA